ncbi:NADPH-dependent 2,4-dienoyl-CoA reductase [Corynebacterium heidelbergense]|uniref:NADPH-dependent 2,4-dienoyl-CoA reductase n=1 Tax=Corynebacterium heidelbergense TaxID=2055947 RepID=A0A364V5J2_9CORY|nr:NADPH-dependent 2,4-dienoyl-CoA reductase [Corynebacterium heidelbergense]RAV31891.1 NADPH-dependent 2,4-dienoyl-CoA reductase [Corynebacterium heidelbergense]
MTTTAAPGSSTSATPSPSQGGAAAASAHTSGQPRSSGQPRTSGQPRSPKYPTLLSPIQVGKRQLRNRVIMGSMHTGLEDDPADAPKLAAFCKRRAQGGVAAIVTGGFPPTMEGNLTPFGHPFTDEETVAAHRQVTDATHEGGALAILQLLHSGRYGYHPMAVSASDTQSPISPFPAREMTVEEIEATIAAYAQSAVNAREAGYDGVQVMGSEGYLINQFLAERVNQRTDEWGGSVDNRQRFPVEVVKAIRAAVPEDFIVDYRISVLDLVEGGQTQEEILQLAEKLEAAGADMLSSGIGWHEAKIPTIVTSVPRAAFSWATAALRERVSIPVVVSNRINTPEVAESLLDGSWAPAGGFAHDDANTERLPGTPQGDLVSMARPLLADPDFVRRAEADEANLLNICIACNQACLDHTFDNQRASCLVNPRACYETELELLPATDVKRVGVIGGGVAGLFAAEALAQRGHAVEVFEAADKVGGQFRLAMMIPGKEEFVSSLVGVQARLDKLGVKIHTDSPRNAQELLESGFDEVVVASGVTPRIPDFPGVREGLAGEIDGVEVMTYAELVSGVKRAGRSVAVVGAGGIGFDVAEYLQDYRDGKPQELKSWNEQWGVTTDPAARAGLTTAHPHRGQREVFMVQRKITPMGKTLNRTTGWVHRATVAMGGAELIVGAGYEGVDSEGLHITVPATDPKAINKAMKDAKNIRNKEERKEALAQIERDMAENRVQRTLGVDTVVLCTGQESVRPDEISPDAAEALRPRVHVVGGADVAAELDAKRAIRQAVEVAAQI